MKIRTIPRITCYGCGTTVDLVDTPYERGVFYVGDCVDCQMEFADPNPKKIVILPQVVTQQNEKEPAHDQTS